MMVANMWKTSFLLVLLISAVCGNISPPKKRVCVIGAGISGLVSTKQMSLYPDEFEPIVFEKQSDVGGNWIYTNSTTVDEHGLPVHSSIYKYLRMNGAVETQGMPDYHGFNWDKSTGNYPRHYQILAYLRDYAERYKLKKYVQFNTNVEYVSPLPGIRWLVATRDLNTNETKETECDALIVGNGNNFKSYIPVIPGIDTFPGRVIHSHVYREPEIFINQTVVVLGASFSGTDIGIDIARFADKVYLSHRHDRLTAELPKNMEQVLGVVGAEGSELILSDGSKIKADAFVYCTGYMYHYSFMNATSGIVVEEGKYVRSVYKHLINIEYPTMAILNLPIPGYPIGIPYVQAGYFIAVLRGKIQLPSRDEMLKNATLPAGVPKKKAHYMLESVFSYYNEMAVAGGFEPFSEKLINTILTLYLRIVNDPMNFREKRIHFNDDWSFVEL